MSKEKTIYELDLHESMVIRINPIDNKGYDYDWQVTRVASGWVYQDPDPRNLESTSFFVPFDNSFQNN